MSKPLWLEPPDDLTDGAKAYWTRYAKPLHARGELTQAQLEKFKSLCRLLSTAAAAEVEIQQHGVVIRTNSGTTKANPAVNILLEAQRNADALLGDFGLR